MGFMERPYLLKLSRSERMILAIILKKGPISQAAIASECNLRQQSVSRIMAALSNQGLIESNKKISHGKRGQSSSAFELTASFTYSLGVAIMTDTLSFSIVDFAGKQIASEIVPIESNTPSNVLALVKEKLQLFETQGLVNPCRICGVGVAMSGYYVEEEGYFNTPPSMPEWAFVNVASLFSDALNLPAWADNDGNTAAIGEALTGVGRSANSFAYLYLSSGFGGGIIQDGKLLRGRLGNAGEFAGILPLSLIHI